MCLVMMQSKGGVSMKVLFSQRTILIIFAMLTLSCSGCVGLMGNHCCADISGTWNFHDGAVTSRPITFEQTGCTFSGVTPGDTIHGTIYGNEVHLTQLVTGETMEGPVLRAECSYFDGRKIIGVFTTPEGETGEWIASRAQ